MLWDNNHELHGSIFFFNYPKNLFDIKLKTSEAIYPTSNTKSLACDTANEHALTFRQLTPPYEYIS